MGVVKNKNDKNVTENIVSNVLQKIEQISTFSNFELQHNVSQGYQMWTEQNSSWTSTLQHTPPQTPLKT